MEGGEEAKFASSCSKGHAGWNACKVFGGLTNLPFGDGAIRGTDKLPDAPAIMLNVNQFSGFQFSDYVTGNANGILEIIRGVKCILCFLTVDKELSHFDLLQVKYIPSGHYTRSM
jgi:hypothetical protein